MNEMITLPEVSIKVEGSIALIDNLQVFGAALTAYVSDINKVPQTDEDFGALDAAVKTLKKAEDALDTAEAEALAQTASIDTMRKAVAGYKDLARTNRLLCEKIVKSEKENRRSAIVNKGQAQLGEHLKALNEAIGKPYMPAVNHDFPGVVKGLKTIDSIQKAVDAELSRCKLLANECADRIRANMATLRELGKDHVFLFSDTAQIVHKQPEDLTSLVKARIADHTQAENARLEKEREKIREEDRLRAEAKVNQAAETPAPVVVTAPVAAPAQITPLPEATQAPKPVATVTESAKIRPSNEAIIRALSAYFKATPEDVQSWISFKDGSAT